MPSHLSPGSWTLLTDLYQITMAAAYFEDGRADDRASFQLFFRKAPFGGRGAVACGLATAVEYLERLRCDESDIAYLRTLVDAKGHALFSERFLNHLRTRSYALDLEALPEGTLVFPNEPILRVTGPLLVAQLVETALLAIVNFQTLIATKAARVVEAAAGDPVIEFGARRAHGLDGALAASRAAYIGGCRATSNVLAGKLFGIPVRGTHAHSLVMAYGDELDAFRAYARALPDQCVFLVDTYDTIEGVKNAVKVGQELRLHGHELLGIRLDSGDLCDYSIRARQILDAGGFPNAVIYASSDLDDHIVRDLKARGAKIGAWGVGTSLVTGRPDGALGGVYKLAAIRDAGQEWVPRIKRSNDPVKTTIPGRVGIERRFDSATGRFLTDVLYDVDQNEPREAVDPAGNPLRTTDHRADLLLTTILTESRAVAPLPDPATTRAHAAAELARCPGWDKKSSHEGPDVALSRGLFERKKALLQRKE